MILLQFILLPI